MGLFGSLFGGGGVDKSAQRKRQQLLDEEKAVSEKQQLEADELKRKQIADRKALSTRSKLMQGGGRSGLMFGGNRSGVA